MRSNVDYINMKTTIITLTTVLIAAAVLFVTFSLSSTYIRNTAIDGCAMASRNIYTEQGENFTRVIQEPDKNAYKTCLDLKKIK